MNRNALLVFLLIIFSIPYVAGAYSMQQVDYLLGTFNVPGSLINSLQPVNVSYAGTQYLILYKGTNPAFVINLTGSYSLVINATAVYNVIRNKTIDNALAQVNFSQLKQQMKQYEQSSSGPIDDCLVVTGLNTGATCTLANNCASCQSVPLCECALNDVNCPGGDSSPGGGPSGIFGEGLIQFETNYAILNSSFNQFISSSSGLSRSNVLANISEMNSAFANITNLSQSIGNNPLFPPTANVTSDMIAGCSSYVNQSIAPWYCNALGYCQSTTFNNTKLAYINFLLSSLDSLPISNAQVFAFAQNVSANESAYAYPVLSATKLALLGNILNKTIPHYGALVNNTALLLTHIVNDSLKKQLDTLSANYNSTVRNYFYANLTKANITLGTQYDTLMNNYDSLNATYSRVASLAENNTAKIIELQISSSASSQYSDLALKQLALNNEIANGGISNLTPLNASLTAISSQLASYSVAPITLTEIARGIDAPFIRSMASALSLAYPAAVSSAPLLGALLSLIIGIVLIAVLLFARSYMKMHRKISRDPRTDKHWRILFILLAILVLAYVAYTYSLLVQASSFAPFSAFQGAYRASPYVVVAVNGTPTYSEVTCASKISAHAIVEGKKPIVASFMNGICKVANSTSTVDSCLGVYANSNIPVVVLTNSSHEGIQLYSLYGTVLNVEGNDTLYNACYVSFLSG